MIAYWVVPYLVVAAPPIILLLSVMLAGCTMTRTDPAAHQARLYSDPNNRAGEELIKELEQREVRAELRRIIDEAQQ